MGTILAVDVGRTGCRAALWSDNDPVALGTTKGEGSIGLTVPDGAAITEAVVRSLAVSLLQKTGRSRIDAVGIGVPGGLAAQQEARELAERVLASLPASSAAVTSDAVTSHAGAFAGAPGVVLAAGTGAVAIALGEEEKFRRIDGLGPWLGDEGSGAWIGLRGLRAAARADDDRGPATALQAVAQTRFGSLQQLAVRLSAEQNPARMMASFAPAVAQAAEQGDPVALQLMHRAAVALSQLVIAGAKALNKSDPVPVAITGGLANMGRVLLEPLHDELGRSEIPLQIMTAQGTSIDGARRMAMSTHLIHDPWIVRAGKEPAFPGCMNHPNMVA
jgi:N-acetylglucosamine kinase-like BadF-type ATPase